MRFDPNDVSEGYTWEYDKFKLDFGLAEEREEWMAITEAFRGIL